MMDEFKKFPGSITSNKHLFLGNLNLKTLKKISLNQFKFLR